MVKMLAVSALLLGIRVVATAETDEASRSARAVDLVSRTMRLPPGTGLSFYTQQARILGDQVAIAICKSMTVTDLMDPGNGQRVLMLVRDAFSDTEFITAAEDKNPGVSLLLLHELVQQSAEPGLRRQARELATSLQSLRHVDVKR
jgi:hypothetical protein